MSSVLITGATRGLGLQLGTKLLASPSAVIAKVFLTGRAEKAPTSIQQIINEFSGRAHYVVLDVTNETNVEQAVQDVQAHLDGRGLDMIVNNAGAQFHEGQPSQVTVENLEKMFSINVSTVQRMMTAFLPLLEQGDQKKIMNVSSTLGSIGLIKNFALADTPSYKISKAALNMLTSLWALELGPKGFTVFVVSPGWLKTDLGGQYADLEVSQGADQVVKILLEANFQKDNGAFRDIFIEGHPTYPGTDPPW